MDAKFTNRRRFLRHSAQTILAVGAFHALPQDIQAHLIVTNEALVREDGFSIIQGLTTDTSTQLTVDVPKDMHVNYVLTSKDTGVRQAPDQQPTRETRSHSSWGVDKISFSNLSLGQTYVLTVADRQGKILDQRRLRTLDIYKGDPRIAVVSCMLDHMTGKEEKWNSLFNAKPDLCFFIGDNVYGDIGISKSGPEMLWRRYIETRRAVPFYHTTDLIPCIAVWDDHDYGKNDANFSYPHREDSLKTFKAFFAQDQESDIFRMGVTVGSRFTAFGHDFIMMDNRYFRDSIVNGDKTFWGAEQMSWLGEELLASQNPLWLMQGCQFFGGYSKKHQAFETNYQNDFTRFKNLMKSANRPTLLLAGDVHHTELMEIEASQFGYKTFEVTSSSMHSFPKIGIEDNPRRINVESGHNHMIVDIVPTSAGCQYEIMNLSKNNKVNFKRSLFI